jgi:hypothetical protein
VRRKITKIWIHYIPKATTITQIYFIYVHGERVVHANMEAKKFWDLRVAGKPKTQENQWCSSSESVSLRIRREMLHFEYKGRKDLPLLKKESCFSSVWLSTDWMRPTHIRKVNLLQSVFQCMCSSHLEPPSQKHQISGQPMAHKLIITAINIYKLKKKLVCQSLKIL